MQDQHIFFMQQALRLAETNLGQTWPNPTVGAVIVKDGVVVGKGCTARGGRPHAETEALANAGAKANGATLYVTLEPCAHHGKTPPCTDAIIKVGIVECVIACGDSSERVNGKGIAALKAAGICVTEGVCKAEARKVNCGFFSLVEKKRPHIALKIATSSDGMIAYPQNNPTQWITGESARSEVHQLRSQYDAVLTGIGTVLADDPLLTCRIRGREDRSPVRVVLDRHHRLPKECKLMKSKDNTPLWVLDAPTVEDTIKLLAEKGITRLLVEAGQKLGTAFLESGMVDRIYWFRAPFDIGNAGLSAFLEPEKTTKLLAQWKKLGYHACPPDTLEILEPCLPAS